MRFILVVALLFGVGFVEFAAEKVSVRHSMGHSSKLLSYWVNELAKANEKHDTNATEALMNKIKNWQLLHLAAKNGNERMGRLLIRLGANIDEKDKKTNWTPLFNAAQSGKVNMVNFLIKNGANVNARSNLGVTALMTAATFNRTTIVEILIDNGANVTAQDHFGSTALHRATKYGFTNLVQILKEAEKKSKSSQILNKYEDSSELNEIAEKINVKEVKQPEYFVNIPKKPIDKQKLHKTTKSIGRKEKLEGRNKYKDILKKHEKMAQFNKTKFLGNKTRITKSN